MSEIAPQNAAQSLEAISLSAVNMPAHFPVARFLNCLGEDRELQKQNLDSLAEWLSWDSLRSLMRETRGQEILSMRQVLPKTCAGIDAMLNNSAVLKEIPANWHRQVNSAGNLICQIRAGEIRTLFKEDIELFLAAFSLAATVCNACAKDLNAWKDVYIEESKGAAFRPKTKFATRPDYYIQAFEKSSVVCMNVAAFFKMASNNVMCKMSAV